ncbi:O-acetyltransferase OatA [Gimesia alba]|uniref:O-acetyltransferase OatA n=1 Tax=Gimesia alba TaxID=2527973 RepID=A0A517RBN2_9PLAN|nr:acyltransferase [Gimesia alba]QDT41266.1 O-acetyltransferase OatA [Gimesia alba]
MHMNSPSFEPITSEKHVPALDGIRGIAILMVLGFHGGLIIRASTPVGSYYRQMASFGWSGVDLFFVLSGFLITGILLDTRDSKHYYRSFYFRRVLRIFPLYYGVILVLFLSNPEFPNQIWYWLYLQNWRPAFGGSTPPMMLQPFWSLAIEEQFYLFWPFAIYFLNRRSLSLFCGCMILMAIVLRCIAKYQGVDPMTIYTLTVFRLDTLSAGALIAIWLRNTDQRKWLERFKTPCLLITGLALIAVVIFDGGFRIEGLASQTIGYTLFAMLCAFLIAFVMLDSPSIRPLKRILEFSLLRYFGNRSYAIYIFQMLVLIPLNQIYLQLWKQNDVNGWRAVYTFCVGVVIILILAIISWHCYEKQFLKLKRFFPRQAGTAVREAEPVV